MRRACFEEMSTAYNDGYVMTLAIDRNTWLAARPRDDRQVAIFSLNVQGAENST